MACLLSLFGTAKSGVYFSPATGSASSRFTTHIITAGFTLLPKKKHYSPPVCPFNLTMPPGRKCFVFVMSLENARLSSESAASCQGIICSGEMVRRRFGDGGTWQAKRTLGEKRCLLTRSYGFKRPSTTLWICVALVMCPLVYCLAAAWIPAL